MMNALPDHGKGSVVKENSHRVLTLLSWFILISCAKAPELVSCYLSLSKSLICLLLTFPLRQIMISIFFWQLFLMLRQDKFRKRFKHVVFCKRFKHVVNIPKKGCTVNKMENILAASFHTSPEKHFLCTYFIPEELQLTSFRKLGSQFFSPSKRHHKTPKTFTNTSNQKHVRGAPTGVRTQSNTLML